MEDATITQTTLSDGTEVVSVKPMSSLAIGLNGIGWASGLIYGVATKKPLWMVLLYMIGGGAIGYGLGTVVDSVTKK